MIDFFTHLLDPSGFIRRWDCGSWGQALGWLHILSDLGVWSAYVAIPFVLAYFVTQRRDLPFQRVFWLFVAFILACGTTHLMEAVIFWWPVYRLAGVIKVATAVVSWATIAALIPVLPRALAMRSPEELQREVERRSRELAEANASLRQSERHFRELAEGLPQLVWTARADGSRDYLSRQWCAYTGASEEAHLDWGWLDVIHPDDRDAAAAAWREAIVTSQVYDYEYRIRSANGQYRWFTARGVPFRDHAGQVVKWFGTSTDIDDRKRAEEALRGVSRRKDEFLATLAHELRNPLAPLRTALYTLEVVANDAHAVEDARSLMERQVRLLVRLIDDLLDISRISQGKIQLRKQRVELADVIQNAVETSQPHLDSAGLRLERNLPDEPIVLHADPDRLGQVVSNLLNNAAKFTPVGGRVTLAARTEESSMVLSVRDTGVGIAREQLPRLFEMYSQLTPVEQHGGLGIGLSLVRGLVVLHGGTATAHSDGPGTGSEFIVRLPLAVGESPAPAPAARAAANAAPEPAERRILIVDDNRDAAESLGKLLELVGYRVRVAFDGPQALHAARTFLPEMVLLDIGMPGMSGHEVARTLRSEPAPLGEAVLVALTGWGQDRDRQNSREAGFNVHLVKPVELHELLPLLAHLSK
jgi:PAS domain S-box-containing protein